MVHHENAPAGRAETSGDSESANAEIDSLLAFQNVQMRIGTVIAAEPNPTAKRPAFVLTIDFGPKGTRRTSAQLTENYNCEELVGRQVVAVTNLPPIRVAGVKSEVLVLGAVDDDRGVVLLSPDSAVSNGTRVA